MRVFPIFLALAAVTTIVGCGDSDTQKPANAAPIPTNEAPTKTPTTQEEKIAAIEKSSMPEDQKKAAIEQVRSGKL